MNADVWHYIDHLNLLRIPVVVKIGDFLFVNLRYPHLRSSVVDAEAILPVSGENYAVQITKAQKSLSEKRNRTVYQLLRLPHCRNLGLAYAQRVMRLMPKLEHGVRTELYWRVHKGIRTRRVGDIIDPVSYCRFKFYVTGMCDRILREGNIYYRRVAHCSAAHRMFYIKGANVESVSGEYKTVEYFDVVTFPDYRWLESTDRWVLEAKLLMSKPDFLRTGGDKGRIVMLRRKLQFLQVDEYMKIFGSEEVW
jgi:hypothetical protein